MSKRPDRVEALMRVALYLAKAERLMLHVDNTHLPRAIRKEAERRMNRQIVKARELQREYLE